MKLKRLIIVASLILALATAAMFVIVTNPSLIVSPTILRLVTKRLASSGIHLTWKTNSIKFESHGLLNKMVSATFDDLCLRIEPTLEKACFKRIDLSARYRPLSWLGEIDVYPINLNVDHFQIQQKGTNYSGDLQIRTDNDLNQRLSRVHLVGQARKDDLVADFAMDGRLNDTSFKGEFKGSLIPGSSLLQRVDIPSGAVELIATEKDKNRAVLTLSCPIDIVLKQMALHPKLKEIYRTPEVVHLDISSRANTFFIPDLNQRIDGTMQIKLQTLRALLVKTQGDANVSFSGIPSEKPSSWQIESDLGIHFIVERLSRVAQVLERGGWHLPAPFNVLDGSADLAIKGHLASLSQLDRFPITFSTDLHSANQRIDIKSDGEVKIPWINKVGAATEINFDLQLSDVQLELPDLEIAGLPRIKPDRRFSGETPSKNRHQSSPSFTYHLNVTTPENQPVRILSNITPQFIPVHLDLLLDQSHLKGNLEISEFPLQLFNQKATVERLAFTFKEPMKNSKVSGEFHLYFPEIQITISIDGSVERPNINFASVPPMSPGDMLSMVLYGEPLRDIDIDQASSVSSMNAALDDNVLSLATFLMLSSTPIQNIAYNPQTRAFVARVRLGNKTALSVGAGVEEEHALLIRRIGKGWRISAGVEKTEDDTEAAGSVMIEWQKRY